jgi:hypothetical protein
LKDVWQQVCPVDWPFFRQFSSAERDQNTPNFRFLDRSQLLELFFILVWQRRKKNLSLL